MPWIVPSCDEFSCKMKCFLSLFLPDDEFIIFCISRQCAPAEEQLEFES